MIAPQQPPIYVFGDIIANPNCLEVTRGGLRLDLEPKALRVLFYLIENRERVVTKDELIREAWPGPFVTDNALTRVIAQIRKQLGDNARVPIYVQTLATSGYRFVGNLSELPAKAEPAPKPAESQPKRRRSVLFLFAAAGTVLLAVVVAWMRHDRAEVAPRIVVLQQVTTSVALDRWPSFSPDGSQFAFTSDRTGSYQIYTRSVAPGSSDRQITFDEEENIQPSWSPNGDYIAYASVKRGISIVPASGGAVRYRADFGDSPQWSPNGHWIVFRNTGQHINPAQDPIDVPEATLWMVDPVQGEPRQLTTREMPPGGHENPRWLSDSQHVVFETAVLIPPTTPRPDFIPAIIDIRTGHWTLIPFGKMRARNPIVSPDLRYLYFEVRFGRKPGLWRARIDSRFRSQPAEIVLAANGPLLRDLAFDGTGHRLSFSQSNDESAIWSVSLNADGTASGEPKPIVRERVRKLIQPRFSPDGSKIAYTSIQRDAEWLKMSVNVANADGSGVSVLTAADQQGFAPSWVGAATVGYETTGTDGASYWQQPLNGPARRTNLQLDWKNSDNVRWHGSRVLADLDTGKTKQVVVADLGKAPHAITPPTRDIGDACWSPDGRWIAARERVNGQSNLVVFPSQGGDIETVIDEPGQSIPFDWAPDSKRITFAGFRNGIWNIYWADRLSHKVRQVTRFATPSASVDYPAWSPRGNQIVFERYDQLANIYLAEFQ